MMTNSKLIRWVGAVLIFACMNVGQCYVTPTGNIEAQEIGDAIYRSAPWAFGNDHAAIYDKCYLNGHYVIEVDASATGQCVVRKTLDSFMYATGQAYLGAHSCGGNMTLAEREAILNTAELLLNRGNLYYTASGQIDWYDAGEGGDNRDGWNGSVEDLDNIRCDGLVEVCYEVNGKNVWGSSIVEHPEQHIGAAFSEGFIPDPTHEVMPKVQRGGYGTQYTTLRATRVDFPELTMVYPSGASKDAPTITSQTTINLQGTAWDVQSGVYLNCYYFGYSTWTADGWTELQLLSSEPGLSTKSFVGLKGKLYAFRVGGYDTAENWGDSATKYLWIKLDVPALVAPVNGTNLGTTSVQFSWRACIGAENYHLQIAADPNFVSKICDSNVGNVTTIARSVPNDGKRYYWRVKAGNVVGWSNYSSTWSIVKPVYSMSGYVKTAGGVAMPGVTLTGSNGGGTATTSATGYYVLKVPYNWTGRITPTKTGYSFVASYLPYTSVRAGKASQNFTAYVRPTLSGYVKTAGGVAVSGVTITGGNGGGTTMTSATGYYALKVPYNWTGIITAIKSGYSFVPASRAYTAVTVSKAAQNYVAYVRPSISGYVRTASGAGVGAIPITFTLSNGGGTLTATTNSSGGYEIKVPYNWTGTITPIATNYSFVPAVKSYSAVTTSKSAQNYNVYVKPTISGYVKTSGGVAIAGVTITGSNGGGTVTTSATGYYALKVPYNWTGTITPGKSGYGFTPTNRAYSTAVTVSKSSQNFTGGVK